MNLLNDNEKQYLLSKIRDVADFPQPGIVFKDITTLLKDSNAFSFLIDHLYNYYKDKDIDFIAGIESRGFIFGAALAYRLKSSFIPIRKKGKLPYTTISEKYALEYGFDEVEIHIDAFDGKNDNPNVLLIDDLIATGGTAKAAIDLINKAGANCTNACFIIDLTFLNGTDLLDKNTDVYSVLEIS